MLGNYLLNICRQQKFTLKLIIEFSFLRMKVDDEGFRGKDIWDKNNYMKTLFKDYYNKPWNKLIKTIIKVLNM